MGKQKTYKTLSRRFKKTNPKNKKKTKYIHLLKGRGSKHLMTKKDSNRKLRLVKTKKMKNRTEIKKIRKTT